MRVLDYPHTNAFILAANISGNEAHKILIDGGSSIDIIFVNASDRMGLQRSILQQTRSLLIDFDGKTISALGKVHIPVSFGEGSNF